MPDRPLTSCPACSSRLVRPDWFVAAADHGEIIVRACSECGHRDTVVVSFEAALAWRRVEARRRAMLAGEVLVAEVESWLAGRSVPPSAAA